jgi:tRNA pseudouridine65 synthase
LLKRQLARKVYPVHRLDHRTSGAILFAFDSKTCALLQKALTFKGRTKTNNEILPVGEEGEDNDIQSMTTSKSKKQYLALLRGDWKRKFGDKEEVIIDKPLNVKGITKTAKTVFKLIASSPGIVNGIIDDGADGEGDTSEDYYYSPAACSLVLCSPETGRTHQIRRHAYSMGFPIIGDSQHGDSKINRWWRENRDLDRLFLHCLSLDLPPLEIMDLFTKSDNETPLTQSRNEDEIKINVENNDDGLKEQNNDKSNSKVYDRIIITAPLPANLAETLKHDDMSEIWEVARGKDPRLEMAPYDDRGGTFGRNYKK